VYFGKDFQLRDNILKVKTRWTKAEKSFPPLCAFCRRNLHSLLNHTHTHQGFISSGAPVAATLDCANEGALYVFELNAHKAEISSPQKRERNTSTLTFALEHTRRTRISAFYYISQNANSRSLNAHKQHSSPMCTLAACAWAQHATSSYS
jgi:hypothetical protein